MPGLQEMLVIAVVALLVFGPDRLPEVARNVGTFVGKLRAETDRNLNDLKSMAEVQDIQRELSSLRRELNGAKRDITRPMMLGDTRGPGTSGRMVPADVAGGRPVLDAERPVAGDMAATGEAGTPPPTDPDAT